MKYIIYWYMYSSTLGGGDIAGAIKVTECCLTSYLYDIGYIEWEIVERYGVVDSSNRISYGTYSLRKGDLKSVMIITNKSIEHYISGDNPIHIKMKRKKE